jgi:phenylalanyl-tRNA synthetase beta chain
LDLKEVCAACELDFTEIISYRSPAKVIEPPPKFPAIRRDVAIVVDRDVSAGDVIAAISQLKSPLLESLELFDTYEGEAVPAGKKSLALSGRYRAKDRTLTDEEVNRAHTAVVKEALVRLKAELRQ